MKSFPLPKIRMRIDGFHFEASIGAFLKMCIIIIVCLFGVGNGVVFAQLKGRVIDSSNGSPVSNATISYRDKKYSVTADSIGFFVIPIVKNGILSVTSIGYDSQSYIVRSDMPDSITVSLVPSAHVLDEVVVSGNKIRYKRKNNPAVELMRKVISLKNNYCLQQQNRYSYTSYQKIMAGFNDLQPQDLNRGIFEHRPWLRNNLEVCSYNGKLIMPVTLEETISKNYYQQEPRYESNQIVAHNISGVNTLFQTGDFFNILLKEYFCDIDIYKDNIKLFQNSFCSPIGKDAISFYHFYITDTLLVDRDLCYQLDFTPSNKQDFGFCGQLFVLADSTYQVKKCDLKIPVSSDVNWVTGMKSIQEYTFLENGSHVKIVDDMVVELMVTKFTAKGIVVRNTRHFDYSFKEIPDSIVNGKVNIGFDNASISNTKDYFNNHRPVMLSGAEKALDSLSINLKKQKGAKYVLIALRSLFENFVETGTNDNPSKFDIGPVLSTVSYNFYDGLRLRLGGQSTSNLHPHLFLKGYYAHSFKSKQNYYDGQLIYSLNKPKYLPQDYPRRTISLEVLRDVSMPSDKYNKMGHDNVFTSLKIDDVDKLFLYTSQSFNLLYEFRSGLRLFGNLKHETVNPIGNISFSRLSSLEALKQISCTDATIGFRYSPGETYMNTKQERWVINYDAPVIKMQHSFGIRGLLGGDYNYNYTELEIDKRFWLPMSLGSINTRIRLGAQWNQVPYPFLIMPNSNMSYFINDDSFNLINNMEFLNDRFISAEFGWDLNGKIFNQIPFLKKLKCREFIGAKCLWGKLTDKNNPTMLENKNSDLLMYFPDDCYIMDTKRPYMELSFGIHNIFNLIHIEYIRRLSYLEQPSSKKAIVKIGMEFKF